MDFEPRSWADGPHGGTPLTAAELNRMETGIAEVGDLATIAGEAVNRMDTSALFGPANGVRADVPNVSTALNMLLARAADEGRRVFLPKGTYSIDSPILIPANTHLFGEVGTVLRLNDAFGWSSAIVNKVSAGFSNVYIHDIEIDGNYDGQSGDQTINGNPNILMFLSSASGTPGSNVIVERVSARQSYRLGIALQHIDGGAVRDCIVGPNGRDGITIYGCNRIIVSGNRISSCGDDMIGINSETRLCENIVVTGNILTGPSPRNVGKGIRVLGGRNVNVYGNTIDAPCEIGIYVATWDIYAASQISVIGNTIRNAGTNGSSAKNGILVHANNAPYHLSNYASITDVIVANNIVSAAGGPGIELRSDHTVADELARIKVRGNIISKCAGEGVKVAYTTNCSAYDIQVEDNDCYNNGGHGIWAVSAKRIKISGNTCHDNGTGGTNTRGIRAESCDVVSLVNNIAYESRSGLARTQTVGVDLASPVTAVQIGDNIAYNHSVGQISYANLPGAATSEGWHGKTVGQLTVTGSRGGNAALADLLTKLALKGVVVDNSTA